MDKIDRNTNVKMGSVLCALFIFFSQALLAQGKLFIIGGGKRPTEMIQRLILEAGVDKKGYITILPMASEEQDSSIFYAKKQFVNAGIRAVTGFIIQKGDVVNQAVLDSIAGSALIYIAGGDQSRFMDIVKGTNIEKAIWTCYKRGGLIAGTSAGAAVMSEKMITGVELLYKSTTEDTEKDGFKTIEAKNIEIGTGLGFLKESIVDQHFVKRKRYNRLIAVALEHPRFQCVGIDEATAILVKDGVAEVVGDSQVVVIRNDNKAVKVNNGKIGAKGLKLDILLNGDKFIIK